MTGTVRLAAVAIALAAPNLQATIAPSLYDPASCQAFATPPESEVFCGDGNEERFGPPIPGGHTPNEGGLRAVTVPAAYGGDGYTGLPEKDPMATAPGADRDGNVALNVVISLPRTPPPPGGYPLIITATGFPGVAHVPGDFGAEDLAWHSSQPWFAMRGYVGITYTTRGTVANFAKGSSGEFHAQSRRYEVNDVQHLACQFVAEAHRWTGIHGAGGGATVSIDPEKIVVTGVSLGAAMSWMLLTDPVWRCTEDTGAGGTTLQLAAAVPIGGWTDLAEALVPTGRHALGGNALPAADGCDSGARTIDAEPCAGRAWGVPKHSYLTYFARLGSVGTPVAPQGAALSDQFLRVTYSAALRDLFECLLAPLYPLELNPACRAGALGTDPLGATAPALLRDSSAYYQDAFFANLARDARYRVPVFAVLPQVDTLFAPVEVRRMVSRLRAVVPDYPIRVRGMDGSHGTHTKMRDYTDVCGPDAHACRHDEYRVGDRYDFDRAPRDLRRVGVATEINRFLDHHVQPRGDAPTAAPASGATAVLQVCAAYAEATGVPASASADMFHAPTYEALANARYELELVQAARSASFAADGAGLAADPVLAGTRNGQEVAHGLDAEPCVVRPAGAPPGPGVAVFESPVLDEDVITIGAPELELDYAVTPADADHVQIHARVYDVYPDGRAVLMDRGLRRLTAAEAAAGTIRYELLGNAWRALAGHRLRVEIVQDDEPYLRRSTLPSSVAYSRLKLTLPRRVPANRAGAVVAGPDAPGFTLVNDGEQGHFIERLRFVGAGPGERSLRLHVDGREVEGVAARGGLEYALAPALQIRPGSQLSFRLVDAHAATMAVGVNVAHAADASGTGFAASWPLLGLMLLPMAWRSRGMRTAAAAALLLAACGSDVAPELAGAAARESAGEGLVLQAVEGRADDGQPPEYRGLPLRVSRAGSAPPELA